MATETKEGEEFSLYGKKNEEEMHEQQHPLLVTHDESHTEPMENPKYQNASENEKNSNYKSECEDEENPKHPSESEDEEKTQYPSESEGEKKRGSLNRNLPLCEGILERNESVEEGCDLFSPVGKKNEEEINTVVVQPHLSDGKRKQELMAESDSYSTSSDGEEAEEKEERKREMGSTIKDVMKRRKVMNTNKE